MIELTNAYSYFASAILLLGWTLTSKQSGSKSIFGVGFFIAFSIYLISSYIHFSEIEPFLKQMSVELLALAIASFVLNRLKSSVILNIILFVGMLIGFSKYAFHSDRTGGYKLEAISQHDELLVELGPAMDISVLNNVKEKYNLIFSKAYHPSHPEDTDLDDFYLVEIPDDSDYTVEQILYKIKKTEGVDWVEYNEAINTSPVFEDYKINRKTKKSVAFNDALVSDQWAFDILNMDKYYQTLRNYNKKPKKTALLAILDTGVDSQHEDIKTNYKSLRESYDNDQKGHGTHCAGIAAGITNNKIGIASFVPDNKWVNITSIKVLNRSGGGTQNSIIRGIILAADKGADVISMSLGARANLSRERAYEQAIEYANKAGAIVVVAAGNSNLNANTFSPANTHMAITVSAIDNMKDKASFSNYFTDMEYAIAAPGVDILSTVPGDGYTKYSGTSMAAPHVAGLIAVMKAINPSLTTKQAINILKKTGLETNDTQRTGKLINPDGAIRTIISNSKI